MLSRPWPTTFEQTVPHNFELRAKQLFCAYMQKQIPVRSRCSTFLQAAKLLSEVKAEKAALELQKQVCSSTHMSATCVHLLCAFHTHVCHLRAFVVCIPHTCLPPACICCMHSTHMSASCVHSLQLGIVIKCAKLVVFTCYRKLCYISALATSDSDPS